MQIFVLQNCVIYRLIQELKCIPQPGYSGENLFISVWLASLGKCKVKSPSLQFFLEERGSIHRHFWQNCVVYRLIQELKCIPQPGYLGENLFIWVWLASLGKCKVKSPSMHFCPEERGSIYLRNFSNYTSRGVVVKLNKTLTSVSAAMGT